MNSRSSVVKSRSDCTSFVPCIHCQTTSMFIPVESFVISSASPSSTHVPKAHKNSLLPLLVQNFASTKLKVPPSPHPSPPPSSSTLQASEFPGSFPLGSSPLPLWSDLGGVTLFLTSALCLMGYDVYTVCLSHLHGLFLGFKAPFNFTLDCVAGTRSALIPDRACCETQRQQCYPDK